MFKGKISRLMVRWLCHICSVGIIGLMFLATVILGTVYALGKGNAHHLIVAWEILSVIAIILIIIHIVEIAITSAYQDVIKMMKKIFHKEPKVLDKETKKDDVNASNPT